MLFNLFALFFGALFSALGYLVVGKRQYGLLRRLVKSGASERKAEGRAKGIGLAMLIAGAALLVFAVLAIAITETLFTALTVFSAFLLVLPLQLLLCFKARRQAVKLLPVLLLSAAVILFGVLGFALGDWSGIGFILLAALAGLLLLFCAFGWLFWGVIFALRNSTGASAKKPSLQDGISASPTESEIGFIKDALYQFNRERVGDDGHTPLNLILRGEDGAIIGGLLGGTYWGWLYVDILWVKEEERGKGLGSKLLEAAEKEAVLRGCHHAHLDTMSWQAPAFYQKHGYTLIGTLPDIPSGNQKHLLMKALK